jgi:hypothetical protein
MNNLAIRFVKNAFSESVFLVSIRRDPVIIMKTGTDHLAAALTVLPTHHLIPPNSLCVVAPIAT